MKNLFPSRAGRAALALLLLAAPLLTRAQGVGIGTSAPDPKAALDVRATDRGVLVPRLSAAQRTGIAAPPQGLLVYQTDAPEGFYYFGGGAWVYLNPSGGGAGDNLGNHTATQPLNLQANPLVGSGSSVGTAVGLGIRADGGLNLAQNTAGLNLLVGYQAGAALTTGTQNQFVGYQSGFATTSGGNNLFEGLRSGYSNTSGTNNLFLGTQSGFSNLTGSANLFLGVNSGYANTSGGDNLFLGLEAGRYNTSGGFNLFAGSASGQGNTSGAYNVMLGYVSGQNAATGTANTFVGAASGQANTSGSTNVFTGFQAGYRNTSADNNTFSGNAAGSGTTTGGGNVFSGTGAGQANVTGTFNTALGYGANLSTANLTNATALGANAVVGQSNALVLGNGASVGIGTSTPSQKLEVAGQVFSSTGGFRFPDNSVQTTAATGGAALTAGNGLTLTGTTLTLGGTLTQPTGLNLAGNALTLSGGRLGLGTSAPATTLEVGTGDLLVSGGFQTPAAPQGAHVQWNRSGGDGETWLINSPGLGGNPGIRFGGVLTNNGTSVTEWARFSNSGNFGIGTAAPGQKLEVAGQIYSNTGGFRFPDGTVQTTAAGTGGGDNLGDAVARSQVNLQGFGLIGSGAALPAGVVGVGVRADGGLNLGQNTFGSNVFIGYQAGQAITPNINSTGGLVNQFIGYQSGQANTTGSSNQFSGYQSGFTNMTGSYNHFSGLQSGYKNTIGSYNTFSGNNSGFANTTGINNTFSGASSGFNSQSGDNNVFEGAASGYGNTAGRANTFCGTQSGYNNVTGSNNVALGFQSGPASGNLFNTVALGNNAQVNTSNKIRLGDTNITVIEGQVPFSSPSDARFKYDIQPNVPGLAFISQLKPVTYRLDGAKLDACGRTGTLPAGFTRDPAARVQSGFLAQQVEQAAQAVGYAFDGLHAPANARDHYALSYAQFVVPLVRAVQEQQAQIEALQAQHRADEAAHAADHAALLTVQAQVARLLDQGIQAQCASRQ